MRPETLQADIVELEKWIPNPVRGEKQTQRSLHHFDGNGMK